MFEFKYSNWVTSTVGMNVGGSCIVGWLFVRGLLLWVKGIFYGAGMMVFYRARIYSPKWPNIQYP